MGKTCGQEVCGHCHSPEPQDPERCLRLVLPGAGRWQVSSSKLASSECGDRPGKQPVWEGWSWFHCQGPASAGFPYPVLRTGMGLG